MLRSCFCDAYRSSAFIDFLTTESSPPGRTFFKNSINSGSVFTSTLDQSVFSKTHCLSSSETSANLEGFSSFLEISLYLFESSSESPDFDLYSPDTCPYLRALIAGEFALFAGPPL